MKKIVINRCYGGFGLSSDAMKELIRLECPAIKMMTEYEYTGGRLDSFISNEKKQSISDGYEVGWIEDVLYKDGNVYMYEDKVRDDPTLIQIIETMNEKASGKMSELKIVEIPENIEYEIEEYDGLEWIAEAHQIWS